MRELSRSLLAAGGALAAQGYAAAWALDRGETSSAVRATLLSAPQAAAMPEQDQVLLWISTPDDEDAVHAIATAVLDSEAVARIELLQDARDRVASLAAHASLRIALGAALGLAPRDICFERGAFGKPKLRSSAGLHFSLSHTRCATGFALARSPVGFDVERICGLSDIHSLADVAFAAEMRAALAAAPKEAKMALFYRFWTLGEAHIKATGLGVSQGLQTFAFTASDPPRLSRATPGWGPPERWRFGVL